MLQSHVEGWLEDKENINCRKAGYAQLSFFSNMPEDILPLPLHCRNLLNSQHCWENLAGVQSLGKHLGLSIPHSASTARVGKVQSTKTFFSQILNLSNSLKKGGMLEAETSEYRDQELNNYITGDRKRLTIWNKNGIRQKYWNENWIVGMITG